MYPEVTAMPLTSDMREPVAVAVGSALARLAGADAAPAGPAIAPPREAEPTPAPVTPPPAPLAAQVAALSVVPVVEEVDIPALYRELRHLADTSDLPRARTEPDLREMRGEPAA